MNDILTYGWGDTIEITDEQHITLEPGTYNFTVEKFERGEMNATEKLPACKVALMTLRFDTTQGAAHILDRFPLCSVLGWKMGAFFESLGMQRNVLDFDGALGKTGAAKVTKVASKSDPTQFYNNITAYIKPQVQGMTAAQAQAQGVQVMQQAQPVMQAQAVPGQAMQQAQAMPGQAMQQAQPVMQQAVPGMQTQTAQGAPTVQVRPIVQGLDSWINADADQIFS